LAWRHNGRPVAYFDGPGRCPRRARERCRTELDHHANSDTWRFVAGEHGLEVRTARTCPQDGTLDEDDLFDQLSNGTRLLAVGGASNAPGVNYVARPAHDASSPAEPSSSSKDRATMSDRRGAEGNY